MVAILPLATFIVPFAFAFGVAATAHGLPPGLCVFISSAVYAGTAQFAALDLWHAPLPFATLALTILAVNGRMIMLGAALAPWLLKISIGRRFAALLVMTDSTFAYTMASRMRGEMDAGVLFGSGFLSWTIWVASTAFGAYVGALLGDMSRFGLDAVMVAYFSAVVTGQWKSRADFAPFITAAVVAIGGMYILPMGWNIIAGAIAGGLVGVWRHG